MEGCNMSHCIGMQWDTLIIGFHYKKIYTAWHTFLLYTFVWNIGIDYAIPYHKKSYTDAYQVNIAHGYIGSICSEHSHRAKNVMWTWPYSLWTFPSPYNNSTVLSWPQCFYHGDSKGFSIDSPYRLEAALYGIANLEDPSHISEEIYLLLRKTMKH